MSLTALTWDEDSILDKTCQKQIFLDIYYLELKFLKSD